MGIELAKQPLEIREGSCIIEKICGDASEENFKLWIKKYFAEGAVVVLWQMQSVVWGIVKGESIEMDDTDKLDFDTVLEARVFDKNAEIHIVRSGNTFVGRYVKDSGDRKIKYVDSMARLWGEKTSREGSFVQLKDTGRKLTMKVPCEEEAKFYGLVTRNYIGYAEQNGQAGYVDYRYVQITSAEGGR